MQNSPLVALVLANLFPIVGAIFFGWEVSELIYLYWFENIIIGVFNVFKMMLVPVKDMKSPIAHMGMKAFMIPFFIVHYGGFAAGHGVFIVSMFKPLNLDNGFIAVTVASLIASHAYSFLVNFVGKQEYKKTDINKQIFAPYGRVIVVHLTIILGGAFAMILNIQWFAVFFLVMLKTGLDIWAHTRSHQKLQEIPFEA